MRYGGSSPEAGRCPKTSKTLTRHLLVVWGNYPQSHIFTPQFPVRALYTQNLQEISIETIKIGDWAPKRKSYSGIPRFSHMRLVSRFWGVFSLPYVRMTPQ